MVEFSEESVASLTIGVTFIARPAAHDSHQHVPETLSLEQSLACHGFARYLNGLPSASQNRSVALRRQKALRGIRIGKRGQYCSQFLAVDFPTLPAKPRSA